MRSKFVVAALSGLILAGAAYAAKPAPMPTVAQAETPPPADPQNIINLDVSTGGRVKILLRPDKAPYSVDRIKTLVRRHFYDGLTFHRVIEGFMAQGGDPKGTGEGGSDLPDVKGEFNDLPHVRGTMAMARAESPDSANSQFYIMLQPNLNLDGNYTVVGRVISGMEYVDALEKGEPPAHPSKIVHISVESDDEGLPPAAFVPPPPAPPHVVDEVSADAKKVKTVKAPRQRKADRAKTPKPEKVKAEKAPKPAKATKQPMPETAPTPTPAPADVPPSPADAVAPGATDAAPSGPSTTDAAVAAVTADPSTAGAVNNVAGDDSVAPPK